MTDDGIFIDINCTDKDNHALTYLGNLGIVGGVLKANSSTISTVDWKTYQKERTAGAIGRRRAPECVWLEHPVGSTEYRAQMRCPRCNRNPQWPHAKAVTALTTMHAAGVTTVDISRLPKQLS